MKSFGSCDKFCIVLKCKCLLKEKGYSLDSMCKLSIVEVVKASKEIRSPWW